MQHLIIHICYSDIAQCWFISIINGISITVNQFNKMWFEVFSSLMDNGYISIQNAHKHNNRCRSPFLSIDRQQTATYIASFKSYISFKFSGGGMNSADSFHMVVSMAMRFCINGTQYNKRYILSTFKQNEILELSNKLSNYTKFAKIEVILLKIQVLQSVNFLLFSLYFTHCFAHYLRINLADKMSLLLYWVTYILLL